MSKMESVGVAESWENHATRKEMDSVFQLCRRDDWRGVLSRIEHNPSISTTPMVMDNNITTTCLHQAITSKASIQERAAVIRRILQLTPQAARIKNGYGSLPLHVIAQRNTKMKSETKEELIVELVRAYPGALVEEGGVGKRTPLHIIFTDYVSPRLTLMMVESGAQACFMKDKKGYLPAHVACSRHCSPEKLRMLLAVNPDALRDTTADGDTLLSLATSSATKSHPNYALIDELHRQIAFAGAYPSPSSGSSVHHVSFLDSITSSDPSDLSSSRSRLDSNDSNKSWQSHLAGYQATMDMETTRVIPSSKACVASRKRKSIDVSTPHVTSDDPVGLLLHFSRNGMSRAHWDEESSHPINIAQV